MLRRLIPLTLAVLGAAVATPSALAAPTELFFSEYIEGSSNNKALEIYNGTAAPVNLASSGYSVQMFFNGSASAGLTINLTGTVAPGDVFVLAQSAAGGAILGQADQTNGAGWFNGDDAVVLRKGTTIIDSIGQVGFDPGTEWGTGLTSTADNTLRRKTAIEAGDPNAADVFNPATEWDGFATDTFDGLGFHGFGVVCGPPLVTLAGTAATRSITAMAPSGTITDLSIASVSPAPAPGSMTLTPITPASSVSSTLTVSATVPGGLYDVVVRATNSDAETRQCTLRVVVGPVPIGTVQAAVGPLDPGTLHVSPHVGTPVVVRGVIYQKTIARSSAGASQHGFFVQNTDASDDGDPNTSDGIFVFIGTSTTLSDGYAPQVGDEVVLLGTVTEFFNFTQLTSARLMQPVVASMLDLDAVVPAVEAAPPDLLRDAERYWERLEGMRVGVSAGARTVDGLDVFPSTADGELWVMRGDHPVALRTDPFALRVFRDPHPLDNQDPPLFDDGNGYRIMLASLGVKAAAGDNTELITAARTFETLTNHVVGGIYFTFGKYAVQVTEQPEFDQGVDPSTNAPPSEFARDEAYSIADYNVENLYDFRDDPFDTCDFVGLGNNGCPPSSNPNATPFFDYVPASDTVYQARLGEIATQIVEDLHGPDILLAQEAEDQDICAVTAGALVCGTTDNRDGKPDTLQELALRIGTDHGIAYDAAYDRDGSDDRGIVAGFLYRSDRVELLPAPADHPVLGSDPDVEYRGTALPYNADVSNPKALNADLPGDVDLSSGVDGTEVFTRDPQVGLFRIWRNAVGDGGFIDAYAISNHFSSTPDARRGQRTEQAAYNAAIVEALQTTAAGARVDVGGDFNVYPRPDDPVLPPSDQLGPLYDAGLTNLFDVLVDEVPSAAYSYVFQGQTQTLDGQFLTDTALEELNEARAAHVNADFPADTPGDGARGLSDHDPLVAQLTVPSLPSLVEYYADAGFITGNNTEAQLLRFLARAAAGGTNADAQLRAFIDHVEDKTPQFITPLAAEALIDEAQRLLG